MFLQSIVVAVVQDMHGQVYLREGEFRLPAVYSRRAQDLTVVLPP